VFSSYTFQDIVSYNCSYHPIVWCQGSVRRLSYLRVTLMWEGDALAEFNMIIIVSKSGGN
jgi:hypothetical protein